MGTRRAMLETLATMATEEYTPPEVRMRAATMFLQNTSSYVPLNRQLEQIEHELHDVLQADAAEHDEGSGND